MSCSCRKGGWMLFLLTLVSIMVQDIRGSWEEWWTYDGISGPGFWGLINPQWNMCNKGRRQSPINVEPEKLLFDPGLRNIHFDKHKVSGVLQNTGQSLVFRTEKESKQHVNISGGPLAYRYQFEEIYIHYGNGNHRGSEHQIQGHTFPGEIQLYGFNKELYHNMSEAQHKSQGIVGISLMMQIGDTPNPELRIITSAFNRVTYRGGSTPIKHLSLSALLPDTEHFITYEGSTTHPGCWETTVWIILNKPIYVTKQEMYALRRLMQGSEQTPKAPLGNNARPVQPLHHRTVRTNIDFNRQQGSTCPSMYKDMHYTGNYVRDSAAFGYLPVLVPKSATDDFFIKVLECQEKETKLVTATTEKALITSPSPAVLLPRENEGNGTGLLYKKENGTDLPLLNIMNATLCDSWLNIWPCHFFGIFLI